MDSCPKSTGSKLPVALIKSTGIGLYGLLGRLIILAKFLSAPEFSI